MSHIALKGPQTPKVIAPHAAHLGEHLRTLATKLDAEGHRAEADYMTVASVACELTAFTLASKGVV